MPAPRPPGPGRRVLFFDAYPHMVGGAQRSTLLLARGLQERGWSVEVATPGPGPFVDQLTRAGVGHSTITLPPALGHYGHRTVGRRAVAAAVALPPTWLRVARSLKGRFDIVHTVDHRGQVLLGPAARRAGIPVVWHVHNIESGRGVNRFCHRFADRVVVPSRFLAATVAAGRPGDVEEIPNGLPPEVLRNAERPAPPVTNRVVTVGRLDPQKGYETLLEAARIIRDRGHDITCVIAGGTPKGRAGYAEELGARSDRLGLQDVVRFSGPVDDVGALLSEGGVYVQPSRWEVQPLAVMEAMVAGLPVVATRVGAVEELLGGGRGILVPAGDPGALAEAILGARSDAEGRAGRVAAARRYVVDAARPDRMVDRVETLYRSL